MANNAISFRRGSAQRSYSCSDASSSEPRGSHRYHHKLAAHHPTSWVSYWMAELDASGNYLGPVPLERHVCGLVGRGRDGQQISHPRPSVLHKLCLSVASALLQSWSALEVAHGTLKDGAGGQPKSEESSAVAPPWRCHPEVVHKALGSRSRRASRTPGAIDEIKAHSYDSFVVSAGK